MDSFIERIRSKYSEDEPRLVYADWLEDNGDISRAEYIRNSIVVARYNELKESKSADFLLDEPPQSVKDAAEKTFLLHAQFSRDWICKSHRFNEKATWERGFLKEIELYASDFVDYYDEILAGHPLQGIRLRGFFKEVIYDNTIPTKKILVRGNKDTILLELYNGEIGTLLNEYFVYKYKCYITFIDNPFRSAKVEPFNQNMINYKELIR